MPQPSKQQFDAASEKVASSAPPGLSESQFFDLVDKELSSVSVMEQGARSAATSGQPEEPGFLQRVTTGNPLLKGAAKPQSLGDFLSLIIPTGVAEATAPISRMVKAGLNESKGSSSVMSAGRSFARGVKNYANPRAVDPHARFTGPGGFSSFQTSPTPRAGNFGPAMSEGAADITGQAGINELPAYLQQQMMEEAGSKAAGSGTRTGIPRPGNLGQESIPLSKSPKLTGNRAPNLEEGLMEALSSQGAPDIDTRISNLPPGEPAVTASPARAAGPSTIEMELLDKLGGRQGMPTPNKIDTAGWTTKDWADLRRAKGSRDAGKLTGKTADEIKELSGGGPSRTPLEAEERIRNYDPDKHLK